MKLFNAFQLVILLVAWPFLINWLRTVDFPFATAAFYSACACYLVQIAFTTYTYVVVLDD